MDLKKEVGQRFRRARKFIGKSQKELAEIFSMDQSNIARMENGLSFPNMYVCLYLRREHHININWLVGGEGEMIEKEAPGKRGAVDYEEYTEEIEEMLYYLDNVPPVRYEIIKQFNIYKIENKKTIYEYLKKHNLTGRKVT